MAQDVKPTRAEELRLKEQIELAESGHSILEKKRDSLIHDFMEMADDARDVQGEMADQFRQAQEDLDRAIAFEGSEKLRSIAMAVDQTPQVELESKNLMGVKVPLISSEQVHRDIDERGYSILSSTATIDQAVDSYEELLERVIELAETETALIKLLDEIDKTKRRVNALEEKVIPEMKEAMNYVSQVLEESEREETFRLKKIKEKTDDTSYGDEDDEDTATEGFTCQHCDRTFDSERGLHIHQSQKH
ncbi:MAG: V-type ATP synthase subunit D [Candidatus Nanohaloarchaea archaeon]|nr:V-type ATP synthase subunit D [Candidatus Nanohaloarchaea archaeon]